MSTASKEAMEVLHGLLADHFKKVLKGEEPPTSAELNVIRQFLKDNHIEAQADRPGSSFNEFVSVALPFMQREEEDGYADH